jgi:hypothetical protein
MNDVLRKDLEYILPKLGPDERLNAKLVLTAIEDILPERKGAYEVWEIMYALKEISTHPGR